MAGGVDGLKLEDQPLQAEPAASAPAEGAPAGDGAPVSEKNAKKAAEKAAKAAKKAERAAQRGVKQAAPTEADPDDPLAERYGDLPLVASQAQSGRTWTDIKDLTPALADQQVLVRARVHTVRGKGKSAFLVLRQRTATVQAVLFVDDTTVSKGMVKYATNITRESIVDVEGTLKQPQEAVESCSQSQVELQVTGVHAVSRARALPFEVIDAARSEAQLAAAGAAGELLATVNKDTRLDNRYIDLRTPANQAIFRLQSGVCQLFRELLLSEGFQEIHTPKLIAGASEGGAAVFAVNYMGTPACLAQSPQLYKQMAICADFERVFEIGPVFRAENSFTHRHLCEFTGLDFEMAIHEHYHEVIEVIDRLFVYIFQGLEARFKEELRVVGEQYPFEPLKYLPKTLVLKFPEAIQMLTEAGYDADPVGDLTTALERALGELVKAKYNTEFFILERYPLAVRPFYTMPCADDRQYSNSFDVFIRGEEIISGAQRIHDPDLLTERARACEIPVESIQSYIDSFKYGAVPHGGAGVGMERVVMLYCGLDNVRKTSMFPRDPKRLTP